MSSDPHIQHIKDKLDIVDIVNEYVRLTKAGVNFKACCPFHNEKTPSFMVSPDRGSWHCFGCNEGGDIFSFLQKIEALSFPEALKILADRAGVKLERRPGSDYAQSEKNTGKDVLALAAEVFHRILLDARGAETARGYIRSRGIDEKTAQSFMIGYAPDQWDVLTRYLCKRGIGVNEQMNVGLVIKSDRGSFYDRFRDRIMFPIGDHHGHVVGFTGRLLQDKEGQGKYVNTPQTTLFDKGKILYGLDKAKRAIQQKGEAIIVEGQMDVITSHQCGFTHTIASSGTALTISQLQLLKRYTTVLKIAFDQDAAGEKAAGRGIALALHEGFDVRVMCPQEGAGKDADEILRKDVKLWEEAAMGAVPFVKWSIIQSCKQFDATSPKGKSHIVQHVVPFIKELPSAVERDAWISELAKTVGVRTEVVIEEMRAVRTRLITPSESGSAKEASLSLKTVARAPSLFDTLLAMYVAENLDDERVFEIPVDFFDVRFHPLYNSLKQGYNAYEFSQSIEENRHLLRMMTDHIYADFDAKKRKEEWERLLKMCKEKIRSAKKEEFERMIREAEAAHDTDKVRQLMKEFNETIAQ